MPLEERRSQGGTEGTAWNRELGMAMYEPGRPGQKELAVPTAPLLTLRLWNCGKLSVCSFHHPRGPMLWHPQQYTQIPGTHLSDLAGLLTLHLR